ncbi:hypothetical protein HY750_02055, partial [Candidatus Kuenenbacteria bacterium]|nr:hypothetical protein [Candidatus Kuenenbacteria bacterium]
MKINSAQIIFRNFSIQCIHKALMNTKSVRVSGNWLEECNNVLNSYGCRNVEKSKNIFGIIDAKDCMDYFYWGRSCELIYETSNCGYNCSKMFFNNESFSSCTELQYCDNCISCQYLFGCIGLRHKQYCILNKQYTKEEYEKLVPKIIEHMNAQPYVSRISN